MTNTNIILIGRGPQSHALVTPEGGILRLGTYNECVDRQVALDAIRQAHRNNETSPLRRAFS